MTTAFDGINDLRNGGKLSASLPGYTERPAQIEMAELVAKAITEHKHGVIEAQTGTGKSLGYLLPGVRSGKVMVISTGNKALQEQLFYKDIPFVQRHVQRFHAALVKGMGNYLCLDRVGFAEEHGSLLTSRPEFEELLGFLEEEGDTWDGDFEGQNAPKVPLDMRSEINGDVDHCAWKSCKSFDKCYVRKMRVNASEAKVIVVNHSLLMLNLKTGGNLLPPHDVVVIDEAHGLEEVATQVYTDSVKETSITSLLSLKMVRQVITEKTYKSVIEQMETVWQRLEEVMLNEKPTRTLTRQIEEGLTLSSRLRTLHDELIMRQPHGLSEQETALYVKLLNRAEKLADDVRHIFSVTDTSKFVYYLEKARVGRRMVITAHAKPLDVSARLKKDLFGGEQVVICTSATLATGDLSYFRSRIGLDAPTTIEKILPPIFNYRRNALLYLPRTLPEPVYGEGSAEYQAQIAGEMLKLVRASRGRAFLLFSSNRMLEAVYTLIAPTLSTDYPLFKQGEMSRVELTKGFRESPGAVLFGLKSFWEGVDIAGDALSLVVIDKLPFPPPDDPLHEARITLLKQKRADWWGGYTLPQVIIALKQGAGRLIRTHTDRGVIAILDARMYTKTYGKKIANALPPARQTVDIDVVRTFFVADKLAS